MTIETHETFTASVETEEGISYQHPWHLGTHEDLARSICREIYHNRIKHNQAVVTIGLKRNGKLIDVFNGTCWNTEWDDPATWAEYDIRMGRCGPWGCDWNMNWDNVS